MGNRIRKGKGKIESRGKTKFFKRKVIFWITLLYSSVRIGTSIPTLRHLKQLPFYRPMSTGTEFRFRTHNCGCGYPACCIRVGIKVGGVGLYCIVEVDYYSS